MSCFDNIVLDFLKKIFTIEDFHFYIDNPKTYQRVINDIKSGIADYPILLLSDEPYYSLNEDWGNSDFRNEICVNNDYSLTILSKDIDDIISIEDRLKQSLTDPKLLYDSVDNSCCSPAKISLITEQETKRDKSEEYELYQSIVNIRIMRVSLHKDIVNPIKIELDSNISNQIMKHLCVLDEAALELENQMSEILSSDSLSNYQTVEEKMINMSADLQAQYNELRQKYEDVTAQISEMYTFDNLCKEKISIKDHGFKFCYQTMTEEKCDLSKATEIYKEKRDKEKAEKEEAERQAEIRKQKREKRLSRLKRIFSTPGDKILNHYTDAIVFDIKENYADKLGIPVYGGSTLGAMNIKRYRVEIPDGVKNDLRPCISVNTSCQFTFDSKKFTNTNKDGQSLECSYSVNSFPITYSCEIEILGTNSKETNEIKNTLYSIYKNERVITVPDLKCSDEYNVLKLKISSFETSKYTTPDDESQNDSYISFANQYYVYHTYDVDKNELTDNHELQLDLVKQAEYCEICSGKMSIAINKLENDYKNLITPPSGFLSKTFRGTFRSEDFKRLQQMFDYHQQIDKNLFNSVLKDITDVYPLWDRMCKGWSIEQIKTDLEKYLSYFHDRAQQLRTLLGIPASYENYKQPDTPVCTYIINYMSKSSTSLIEDAISAYLEYLHKQQEQRNEEARRKAEEARQRQIEREESGYYDQPSSGGGFLSSMLSTAGGVVLGNKITENNRRKKEKKELQWHYTCSLSCPYRGKDYGPTRCRRDPSTCGHGSKY